MGLALSITLNFACKSTDPKPTHPEEQHLFTKYIAIGNSLSAGYADNGLYRAGQQVAYPNLIAQQMKKVGGGSFESPFFPEDKANGSGYMRLRSITNGMPEFDDVQSDLAYRSMAPLLLEKHTDSINNLGVPGMRMDMAFYPGVGSAAGNMYFERLLPESLTATTTYFAYSTSQNHSFFSFSLGNNDILGYATNGAVTEGPTTVLTDIEVFETGLNNYIHTLTESGQKGVIATIPDVTSTPYFTTVTKALLLSNVKEATGLDFGEVYIETKEGVRPALPDDLFVLELATNGLFGVDGYGLLPINPIEDKYILDSKEIKTVSERTAAFNDFIRGLAQVKGLAVADVHQFLNRVKIGITVEGVKVNADYITGKAFSLDGIHLTPIGNALMANLFIQAINDKYNTEIPPVAMEQFMN